MLVEDEEYFLEHLFHHIPATPEKDEVYWRSCALNPGIYQGEQGYLMYWPKSGTVHHTNRRPEDWY